ncbi:MAG: flagellar hook-basal body complex protein FliE [Clostridiales bacterium]|nr:flagellar hook-basal body complex protein FliE [Clostridiales bacterium]
MRVESYVPSESIFQANFGSDKVEKDKSTESNGGVSFADTLKSSLDSINNKQIEAEKATETFIKGGDADIAEVMLAGEEAKISLQYAVQVRNKLLSAYDEIIKMQL